MNAATNPELGWRAYHLVDHGDRDRLLRELVHPLVAGLLGEGEIDHFFFIRYDLGGPHVRLRVRPCASRDDAVAHRVRAAAAAFFARAPSTAPLPDETVRLRNRGIIPTDPVAGGADDVVHPDNSLLEVPPGFEVERYGGTTRFGYSLDAFALSSLDALEWLAEVHVPTPADRLAEAWSATVRHAWAGAHGADEFLTLLAASVPLPGSPLAAFAERGDTAYERGAAPLRERMRSELVRLAAGTAHAPDAPRWTAGPMRLECALVDADDGTRMSIVHSHAHMAANRLGLRVPEEGYLARMLWRAARDVADAAPGLWHDVWVARRAEQGSTLGPLAFNVVRRAVVGSPETEGTVVGG